MFRCVEMFGGMLVFRRIATADVAAFAAQTQVHPTVTSLQAFFAAFSMWMDFFYVAGVRAGSAHATSLSVASELFCGAANFGCLIGSRTINLVSPGLLFSSIFRDAFVRSAERCPGRARFL